MKAKNKISSFTRQSRTKDSRAVQPAQKERLLNSGLTLEPLKEPIANTILISEVSNPPAFMRSDQNDDFNDLEDVERLEPIKLASVGNKGFVVIDGLRRVEFLRRKGKEKVDALIIGSAICPSQLAMARAVEMTKRTRPLNTMELVDGLLRLRESIIQDFGKDHFFDHGGDRKSGDYGSKESLPDFIARGIGFKKTTVATLLNFGLELGLRLEKLKTLDEWKRLSIRDINQLNGLIREKKLSGRFDPECFLSDLRRQRGSEVTADPDPISEEGKNDLGSYPVLITSPGNAAPPEKPTGFKVGHSEDGLGTSAQKHLPRPRLSLKDIVERVSRMREALAELKNAIKDPPTKNQKAMATVRRLKEQIGSEWQSIEHELQRLIEK
jgi:hypothetical protein